jgi:hypothetical protein
MTNLPIVEQNRLRTGNGVAEVEFEDNSTVRLAPGSEAEFPQLERLATGATASSVRLLRGTAYVSLVKTRGNEFHLLFGQRTIDVAPATHLRLQMAGAVARLAVLEGTLHLDGPAGALDVARKRTVTFDLVSQSAPAVAKNIDAAPFDSWDENATSYHARAATMSALNSSPYVYGLNDLSYYGSFADMGGCGMMWRPYFASAAWDPYANGAWAWYAGAGYSWVSPYPWGWTPYHFGSWSYCSGAGWGWLPGGAWNGLGNMTALGVRGGGQPVPTGVRPLPSPPGRVPGKGEPTLALVNLKPLVASSLAPGDSFVFRRDSAGLGIPREELGELNKFSRRAVQRGEASTHVYLSGWHGAMVNRGVTGAALAATSMHRGSAPARAQGNSSGWNGSPGGNSSANRSPSTAISSRSGSGAGAPAGGRGH